MALEEVLCLEGYVGDENNTHSASNRLWHGSIRMAGSAGRRVGGRTRDSNGRATKQRTRSARRHH